MNAPATPPPVGQLEILPGYAEGGSALRWRGLGHPHDLDVNFREHPRSAVVTRLLAHCRTDVAKRSEGCDEDAWRLTLGGRVGALAAIYALTTQALEVELTMLCPGCGDRLAAGLPLTQLLELACEAERRRVLDIVLSDGTHIRVQRPTAEAQLRWQATRYTSIEEAERAILTSLLIGDAATPLALEPAQVAELDAHLEELDPLACFRAAGRCPACGADTDQAVDLEGLLLAHLERQQGALVSAVHRLASRYGWSEHEILSLPAWRRAAYVRLLDAEAS